MRVGLDTGIDILSRGRRMRALIVLHADAVRGHVR